MCTQSWPVSLCAQTRDAAMSRTPACLSRARRCGEITCQRVVGRPGRRFRRTERTSVAIVTRTSRTARAGGGSGAGVQHAGTSEAGSPNYMARHLQVLEGLEAVRKRPAMYIGSTDSRGLMHCMWEIIDNSVDEALAGVCDRIDVALMADGSVEVRDNGRGIPVDMEPRTGLSGVEVVFTKLHAGGKFGGGSYTASGGLHGVGAVQTTGGGVGAATKLATGMQLGKDDLDTRKTGTWLHVNGNASTVVADLDRPVSHQRHVDSVTHPRQRLINGVVDDLPHTVHEAARVGRADVHRRTLAHRLEAFEDL